MNITALFITIFSERSFVYDETSDTISTKQNVAVTAAHEMAHQWFGNVVSPLWWSHVWLNEGFASFFEEYILNQVDSLLQVLCGAFYIFLLYSNII